MPRRPRLFVPGCLYHVMARGIDGMEIFRDDDDRRHFLTLFEKHGLQATIRCYAWVLMPTHYHLVIRASNRPLSTFMKPLNSHYATYFNKKARRRGYLFQDRFKSIATQDQHYLEQMIRYVHLNPVRAGICRNINALDTYEWSGHAALIGAARNRFQDTATVLRRFAKGIDEARGRYREFLRERIDSPKDPFIDMLRSSSTGRSRINEPGMWVIGDVDFVRKAICDDRIRRLRIARYAQEGWDIERLCKHVAAHFDIKPSTVLERGRNDNRSTSRKIVAFIAHRHLEMPVSAIARYLGVSQPAVSAMLLQGKRLAAKTGISLNY